MAFLIPHYSLLLTHLIKILLILQILDYFSQRKYLKLFGKPEIFKYYRMKKTIFSVFPFFSVFSVVP